MNYYNDVYVTFIMEYRIVGKFGGNNVWRKGIDKDLAEKILANADRSAQRLLINCNYYFGWF